VGEKISDLGRRHNSRHPTDAGASGDTLGRKITDGAGAMWKALPSQVRKRVEDESNQHPPERDAERVRRWIFSRDRPR